jgi:hypothetical protein
MREKLPANKYRVGFLIDMIAQSRQFREIRGKQMAELMTKSE